MGRALAMNRLNAGDIVIGTLRNPDDADFFDRLLPGRSIAVQLDVTDDFAVSSKIPAAIAQVGGLDVLVNNAGHSLIGAVEETTIEEAHSIMNANFFGALRMVKAVLPQFRSQGSGLIMNLASVASTVGMPWTAMYSASKGALASWSDSLGLELAGFGIRVICLEPGGFRTNFTGRSLRASANSMAPYSEVVEGIKQRYAEAGSCLPNDPDKGADVIAQISELTKPPGRMALGADGYAQITGALRSRLAEYEVYCEMFSETGAH